MAQRSSYAQGTPSWVDLQTTDVDGAKAFYGGLFGWTFDDSPAPGGFTYSMARLGSDTVAGILPLGPTLAANNVPPAWNTYLAVDDAERSLKRAGLLGGTVVMPLTDVPGAGRMGFLTDPSGATVGLWEAGGHIGATRVNEPGTLIWNELITPDSAPALDFYSKAVGLDPLDSRLGDHAYTLLQVDGTDVAGATAPAMDGVPPHWHTWFAVADVEATAAAATAAGGTLLVEPTTGPMGPQATIRDPQGAVFSVLGVG